MRRRHIALKITPTQWEYAVASGDHTGASLLRTGVFLRDPQHPLADQLAELLGPLQLTDRLACALPSHKTLLRWLQFPFDEPRKVAAAAFPEMESLLPASLDDRVVYHQTLSTGSTLTVAVERQQIEAVLGQFDDNREPLGYLGLAPFCYVAGLDWPEDSLLLCAEGEEIILSRVEEASVVDLRIMPRTPELEEQWIVQQALMLAHSGKTSIMRLRLLGVAADSSLAETLAQSGFDLEPVLLVAEEAQCPDDLNAVACLAIAATKARPAGLNLRSGPYKLKTEWQALKRRAWFSAAMVLTLLLIIGSNAYLQYYQRSEKLSSLQQQMRTRYQKQFPGEKLVATASLQLQSKLKELQKRSDQFGTDSPQALQVLLAVSNSLDSGVTVDIHDYLHSDEGLRLSGNTESFDAVSRLLGSLQKEPLFKKVRILDSKQAIDGKRVDFQLQIRLKPGEAE